MTQRTWLSKSMTLTIALLLAVPAMAGTLEGQVTHADSKAPMAGVVVMIGEPGSGEIHSSQPTDADGNFSVEGLSAGSYEVAVKSDAGLYVVDTPLAVGDRPKQRTKLLIQPHTSRVGAKTGIWNNPVTATLVVLGGAIIIGVAAEELSDDEEDASPS